MITCFHISLPKKSSYHFRILTVDVRFFWLHIFCFFNNSMNRFALLISSNDDLYFSTTNSNNKVTWLKIRFLNTIYKTWFTFSWVEISFVEEFSWWSGSINYRYALSKTKKMVSDCFDSVAGTNAHGEMFLIATK